MNIRMKLFAITALIVLFLSTVVGMNLSIYMEHGHTVDCPFMPKDSALCAMNITDHIARWQALFTTVLQSTSILSILGLFVAFALIRFTYLKEHIAFSYLNLHQYQKYKYAEIRSTYHLLQAFSQGIIHPKRYH